MCMNYRKEEGKIVLFGYLFLFSIGHSKEKAKSHVRYPAETKERQGVCVSCPQLLRTPSLS